ncbi:MAG: DUF4115 domain-containing protein [bacterium]|nr:DUF4115 domain-containing protein [bacterium]
MTGEFNISDYLKQLREKKGVSLEEAVNTLKISYDFLKAFEEGNFDSLPKDTYTRIFLRVYTEYLDGDVKEVMAGFAALSPGKNEVKTDQNMGEKSKAGPDSKNWVENVPLNSNLILGWIITILVVIVFWGLFCNRKQKNSLVETSFEEKEVSKADIKEAKPAEVKKEVEPQKPKSENLPAAAVDEKSKSKKIVLKARALEDVNLEMIVDDKITIKEVMKKDESRIWTANDKFLINTDNAGALDFTFNDERFGVLGAIGEAKAGINFPPVKKE